MSLTKYKTFMEVVKTNSMSKAAANTHQTVPGISYTISKLEEEWGVALFVRNRGKILLSEAGEALLPYISEVLKAQQSLENEILSLKSVEQGTVRVGGLRCVTKQWIPGIIKGMNEEYPNIQIKIVLNLYEEIEDDLQNGAMEVAFGGEPHSKMLDFYYVMDDPYVVIMEKTNDLAQKKEVSIAEVAATKQNLIMPYWSEDKELIDLMKKSHIGDHITYTLKDAGTIISMVESGMGISILPYFVIAGERAQVKMVQLSDWPPKRFGIVTPAAAKLSPPAKKFIQCTKKWLKENRENICFHGEQSSRIIQE